MLPSILGVWGGNVLDLWASVAAVPSVPGSAEWGYQCSEVSHALLPAPPMHPRNLAAGGGLLLMWVSIRVLDCMELALW